MSESADARRLNPWPRRATLAAVVLFLLSAFSGLILLPELQPNGAAGLWAAICSAAGLAQPSTAKAPVAPDFTPSDVVLRSDFLWAPDAASIGRGATLAQRCAICHGPTGVSRADSPNLGGQYPSVVYKELLDFHGGARANATMSPLAANLSDQEMQDLAAYYAYLPRFPAPERAPMAVPKIVSEGAPMRNIPPCGACHGALDVKTASPWLGGQPVAYVRSQLLAFASGSRRNDVHEQMRNIARNMTPGEIDEAAEYFGTKNNSEGQ